MHAVSPKFAGIIAIAAASALSGCAIPSAESSNPFQEPWPWTKLVAVNRTDHDVMAVRAGRCESGPASRHSQSTPSFCFLGNKPDGPIAVTWNDAVADAEPNAASSQGKAHASTASPPHLWLEDPRPEDITSGYLCVLLRNDAQVSLTVAATAEACAVL
ncbi:hypothetical protein AWV79_12835 [Cupriavidus sp. UYMMa02A]|nr:hypothetical protein AWV79_12835 [Cupriavidus sp. UYMMa02A]